MGSRDRKEYSFIGRSVNLAARVQTLTRIHQVDILVTETVRRLPTNAATAPRGPDWLHEVKYNGYRLRPTPA